MRRKIIYLVLSFLLINTSCKNYLEVNSESKITSQFVFQSESEADKAVLGAYELLRFGAGGSGIHGLGLFYDALCVGSDIELGPEIPTFGTRYNHENFYNTTPQLSDTPINSWNSMYATINRCNIIIDSFEANEAFINADKKVPSALTHLYGEAVAIRATMYFELTRCWGDVIYSTKTIATKEDYAGLSLTDRSVIQEGEIANLMKVEPMMYHLNTGPARTAERMTKEFVQGLIARTALLRGGYALRPAAYAGNGDILQSHPDWGKMVRRTDWKDYYKIANTYLKKVVNEGAAVLTTSDPRTPAAKFGNPFQYVFQMGMNYRISPESIFEVSEKAGQQNERPYSIGRASDGGTTGYPPKAYGQIRFFPTFYYGMFNPKDMRRDVTVTVTALGGVANEKMVTFKKGNKSSGGLSMNKWDYSRMADKTYATTQRQAGIHSPYMRLDDMILLLAETEAVLGNEGEAKLQLLKVRSRAFDSKDADYSALTTNFVNSTGGETLMKAIQDERAFELAGEGQRRYDLIRWGILGKKINEVQNEMTAVISSLESKGYYQFANGNVISSYIYTKDVTKAVSGLSDILTTTCNVDKTDPNYPILFPGWRGTFTDWNAAAGVKLLNVSVAIQGLFEVIPADKAAALVAAGYKKTNWGIDLVVDTWKTGALGPFGGYLPASYAANYPPTLYSGNSCNNNSLLAR